MTTETISAGCFFIGIFATLVIAGLCRLLRDLWSEYVDAAKKATEDTESLARSIDVMVDTSQKAGLHIAQAMDRVKVPEQRDGRWS